MRNCGSERVVETPAVFRGVIVRIDRAREQDDKNQSSPLHVQIEISYSASSRPQRAAHCCRRLRNLAGKIQPDDFVPVGRVLNYDVVVKFRGFQ